MEKKEKKAEWNNEPPFTPMFIPANKVRELLWKDYSYILNLQCNKKRSSFNIDFYKKGIQKMETTKVKREELNRILNEINIS